MTEAVPALPRPLVRGTLLLLTLLLGSLNAVKPLHIDDGAYFTFARQIAAHPLDPYGFSILWYQEPNHANEILAPPVVPYTWALGLRLFGDRPDACKLLLLPWVFLLVYAVYSLTHRFAAGLEIPLTILTLLSPALWPSTNFMLDVPALGLALTAIALFLRACDEDSFFQAVSAGLIAGVAFETKYTACVAVAVLVLAAVLRRRWALGFIAVLLAAHVFCAWEFLIAVLYGRSHFFLTFTGGSAVAGENLLNALQGLVLTKGPLWTSLLSLLGGLTPALLLLSLLALGVRRRWLVLTTALFLGGILLIGLFDSHFTGTIAPSARFFGMQQTPPLRFELADVIFAVFGGVVLLVTGIIVYALLRSSSGEARREVVFLLGWLVLEIAAFFPLTPFPAVRRVLGIFVVLTLLIGRYAALNDSPMTQRRTLTAIVAFGVLLGLGIFLLDFHSAKVQRDAAQQAAEWIREHGGGRVWYTGHWGFQYYAEHNGMQAVIPDYDERPGLPPPTRLAEGDWLVIPDEVIDQQKFQLNPAEVREMARLTFDDPLPLRTVWSFYASPDPVQHQEGPRLQVRIYRVLKDFLPLPTTTPLQ
jgi:Dolichyl-phosphate-mannose-protein mannosyltransferase